MLFLIQNVNAFIGLMSILTICECHNCFSFYLFAYFNTFCVMCHIASCLHSKDWSVLTALFQLCDLRVGSLCFMCLWTQCVRKCCGRFHCSLYHIINLFVSVSMSISIRLAHLFAVCCWPLLESIGGISVVFRRVQDSVSIITLTL